jgi:PTS system nitrogen regulatory IIA component
VVFAIDFLTAERISCNSQAGSKKRILQEIGALLAYSSPRLTADAVFDSLLERERLGSTGLGKGVALPHARMDDIDQACGAFLQLREPVSFDAIDNQPVDLVFGLLVPSSATDEHLQLLAQLASMFSNSAFCEQLRQEHHQDNILRHIMQLDHDTPIAS